MDFESLERIPYQTGTAMLDNVDGKVVRTTGSLSNDDGKIVCAQVYKILQDTSYCLGDEPFKRISISFNDHSYIATLNDKNVFIVCVKKGGE